MRVRAKKHCFAAGGRRRQGDIFNWEPRVQVIDGETVTDPIPAFLEETNLPATSPDLETPRMPGQAPRAANVPDAVPDRGDIPNATFIDPHSDTPEVQVPPSDPDTEAYLK